MKSRIFLLLPVFVLLCGTSRMIPAMETAAGTLANGQTVAHELDLAEVSRQDAEEAGAEWLQTSSLIEKAKQAAENEDWQQALALSRQARQQAELALAQAERESVAWRARVVR
jgi:hypothetical protein